MLYVDHIYKSSKSLRCSCTVSIIKCNKEILYNTRELTPPLQNNALMESANSLVL